ncbi:MAG: hypothetical protein A2W80_14455 [Candidatus Riflebacteria bacterium GWC2_50_8]|nr:MAG: hypothetical protein A2W80_14455 [Candidatus Riflebacteria bacterium GWC2_50_8]
MKTTVVRRSHLRLFLLLISLVCCSGSAQTFTSYRSLVPVVDFDKTTTELERREFLHSGESEVKISNQKLQHVLFRLDSASNLRKYHCDIAFILYEFREDQSYYSKSDTYNRNQNILKQISYYDANGRLKGDGEFDDVARVSFEVKDLDKFEEAMNKIDEQEGNYDPEDASENNIIASSFDSKGMLIRSTPISTKDFWDYQNFMGRP